MFALITNPPPPSPTVGLTTPVTKNQQVSLGSIIYNTYLLFIFCISLHPESGKGSDLSSVDLLSSPHQFSCQSARSFDLDDPGPGHGPGHRPGAGERSGIPRKVST